MKKLVRRILSPFEGHISAELFWMILKYIRARKLNPGLRSLRWIIRKSVESLVNRMKVVRDDNSFANESATIQEILEKLQIQNKYLVDIGAADGISQSSTSLFLNKFAWGGALFEYEAENFSRLAFLYSDRKDLILCKGKVTPLNISKLLLGLDIPKNFGLLNIDIDSYDLAVLRRLLDAEFRPQVISMEINENFGPEFYFEVIWDEDHSWKSDHFFGCSIAAAASTLEVYGYVLVKMEYNNGIFVHRDHSDLFALPISLTAAYRDGYLNKTNRLELFPWNQDMEFMHADLPSKEKILRVMELFSEYSGKYIIKEIS